MMKILINFFVFCFITTTLPFVSLSQTNTLKSATASQIKTRVFASDTFFVINFWATWCKPCVEELGELEKFSQNNKSEAIKVILVSLDFIDDLNTRLIPFINEKKLSCEILLLNETDPNFFIPVINPDWSGSIPATWIIRNKQTIFLERKTTVSELEEIKKKMKD